jgi:hypothetical protein
VISALRPGRVAPEDRKAHVLARKRVDGARCLFLFERSKSPVVEAAIVHRYKARRRACERVGDEDPVGYADAT